MASAWAAAETEQAAQPRFPSGSGEPHVFAPKDLMGRNWGTELGVVLGETVLAEPDLLALIFQRLHVPRVVVGATRTRERRNCLDRLLTVWHVGR
jgi:hypothetical protein